MDLFKTNRSSFSPLEPVPNLIREEGGVNNTSIIILAGGLGTRLRSAVPDLPKCMAPVNGKPFIGIVIDYFLAQGITKFILSLGYMHEVITAYIAQSYPSLDVVYSIENEPLGTGGAIKLACTKATTENVLVTNGDTLFKANTNTVLAFHNTHKADCTLSLKPMKDFSRYGVVALNDDGIVESFKEKQFYTEGLINGGLYALNVPSFLNETLPQKFSFEKDYLEALYSQRKMFGIPQDAYFIDIGIPEDYARAQAELV
jgi:D-glycero-alpha-D-manno-heptose 1-phosphate guanylyltransferase